MQKIDKCLEWRWKDIKSNPDRFHQIINESKHNNLLQQWPIIEYIPSTKIKTNVDTVFIC